MLLSFLSKIKLTVKDVIFILIIGFLLYGVISLFIKNGRQAEQITQITRIYQDSLSSYKTESGKTVSRIIQLEYDQKQDRKTIDSLAKALNVKPKYIKGDDSYVYVTKLDTIVKTVPVYIEGSPDTIYTFKYEDSWTKIKGEVSKLETKLSYLSTDSISRVETVKTNIFGKTTRTVLLSNANPNNKLKAGYSYIQKEKRTYLTIGPSLQYNPFNNKVNIGFSVQYPLIQLKR